MTMRVEDMGMMLNEELSLEERIVAPLEIRIVTAFERSGMVERISKAVEESIVCSLEERIVMTFKRSGMMETIARTVEDRLEISLEERIASLDKFGVAANKETGKQPLVPSGPVGVECKLTEVVQPPSHVVKEEFRQDGVTST